VLKRAAKTQSLELARVVHWDASKITFDLAFVHNHLRRSAMAKDDGKKKQKRSGKKGDKATEKKTTSQKNGDSEEKQDDKN
jgi:hypothetical protein